MKKTRYESKELELAYINSAIVVKGVIKNTGLSISDFRYLMVANTINDRNGYFTIKGIVTALRAKVHSHVDNCIRDRLIPLGYFSLVAKHCYNKIGSGMIKRSAKYTITARTTYLVRKYTDTLRAEIAKSQE